jgi:hypothetical protein
MKLCGSEIFSERTGIHHIYSVISNGPDRESDVIWSRYLLHKAQLLVCAALALVFVAVITVARGASSFVASSWDQCEYQAACDIIGNSNFSFAAYHLRPISFCK